MSTLEKWASTGKIRSKSDHIWLDLLSVKLTALKVRSNADLFICFPGMHILGWYHYVDADFPTLDEIASRQSGLLTRLCFGGV